MSYLDELGWSPFFQQHVKPGELRLPVRIVEEQRGVYRVAGENGEFLAEAAGQLRHKAADRSAMPAVGDWVLVEPRASEGRATIHEVLPRRSKFSRKAAGTETSEQVIAANLDTVFIVTSLNGDLNLRRIERCLAIVWESGAHPVILLSKADLCEDTAEAMEAVEGVAAGVPLHLLSAVTGDGMDAVLSHLGRGQTGALLGSSGVGKSTLINRLIGQETQETRSIREEDGRGRHTTTARRLFMLPGGGMLIDTPGMRELQLWEAGEGLSQTFDDIVQLSADCRFRDCTHVSEPDCAVLSARKSGQLPEDRYESYLKLRREQAFVARRQDVFARIQENRRWRRIHKAVRDHNKEKM